MSLMNVLAEVAGGDTPRRIGQQLGVDERQAEQAIAGAVPVLLGALARNSASQDGASALSNALDRDHDGSILDDIGGFLQTGQAGAGDGILGHVLGNRRTTVEQGIGQMSGMNSQQVRQLLMMLAPLVMGALGREKRRKGLDSTGLSDVLGRERAQLERQPQVGGMLGSLLDRDGDGQVMDDVAKIGGGLLGSLLKRR